jgi:hypothetical protein
VAESPAEQRPPVQMPRPESPPLDSAHPRVKEWVSRFTDGEGVLRFGARMQLPPLTEPDALPVFDDTPPASAVTTRRMVHTLRSTPKPAAAAPTAPSTPAPQLAPAPVAPAVPEPVAAEPPAPVAPAPPAIIEPVAPRASEPEPEPIAFVPQPEHDDVPELSPDVMTPVAADPEIVIVPEPIVLDPAALEPRPLELPPSEPFELTALEPQPAEPEPREVAPASSAPSAPSVPAATAPPKLPALPALPGTPVAAQPEPGASRRGRKRKRERERAARAMQQAGTARTATMSAPRPAPQSVPQPVSQPGSKPTSQPTSPVASRKHVLDEAAFAQPSAPPAGTPAPAQWNSGPRSPAHSNRFVQAVVPLVLMVGVASIAIYASTRTGFDQNRARTKVAATAPVVVPVPDSSVATPAPTPKPVVSEPAADATPPKFCLAVGTYLFNDRALAKARQLTRRTRMKAWVETGMADGSRSYRILMGGFATEAQAERAADRLLARGIVSEAMVEPIPEEH